MPTSSDRAADEAFMRRAVDVANQAKTKAGTSPIGCVIVLDGAVLADGHNEVGLRVDPTAHAEMVTIQRAAKRLGEPDLRRATLYSTLQPCGMCTMASIWAKVGRVVYGAGRPQVHSMYFEDRHYNTADFIRDAFRDDLTVTGGVLADTCADLYYRPGDDVPLEEQGNI